MDYGRCEYDQDEGRIWVNRHLFSWIDEDAVQFVMAPAHWNTFVDKRVLGRWREDRWESYGCRDEFFQTFTSRVRIHTELCKLFANWNVGGGSGSGGAGA